jgi:cytochrome c peroxidase
MMPTYRTTLWLLALTSAATLAACSGDDGATTDGGTDAAPEAAPDVTPSDGATTDADGGPKTIDGFTEEQWKLLGTLSPLPAVPKDPTNAKADDPAAAKLGQMLFFDRSYAGALTIGNDGKNGGLGAVGDVGKVSCASCHGGPTMDDVRSTPGNVSLGTAFGTRNALSLVNSAFYAWTNWGGRFDSQWSLPTAVAENATIMKSTRLQVAHVIYAKYKVEYEAVFGPLDARLDPSNADAAQLPPQGKPGDPAFDGMAVKDKDVINRIFANFGKALQAYVRLLVSRNADFDRYVGGDYGALSSNEKAGLAVFIGKGKCVACHSGPNFSDDQFHALLVPQTGPNVPAVDNGRFQDVPALLASIYNSSGAYSDDVTTGRLTGLVQADAQRGQFRTKGLRGVARSGPYMHSGQMANLDAVVDFYDLGGGSVPDAGGDAGPIKDPKMVTLALTAQEKKDLVAFMKKLDGDPVPSSLSLDTSK